MKKVLVEELLKENLVGIEFELISGSKGLKNKIKLPRIQKPGLVLAGHFERLNTDKIQILGKTEITYISILDIKRRREIIERLCEYKITCFIITKGLKVPKILKLETEKKGIPILRTSINSSICIKKVTAYLEERLAPETKIHGVLVDVFGVGLLLLGKSGIGKSECALELVVKGHRLVADDVVNIKRLSSNILIGRGGSDLIKHHMEIRGLGIINIKDLFGVIAVRDSKAINMVIQLEDWHPQNTYDRIGLDEEKYTILEAEVPFLRLPVSPGRDMAVILEIAARNWLLKTMGYHSARDLNKKLLKYTSTKRKI